MLGVEDTYIALYLYCICLCIEREGGYEDMQAGR